MFSISTTFSLFQILGCRNTPANKSETISQKFQYIPNMKWDAKQCSL